MADKKERYVLWLSPQTVTGWDAGVALSGCKSRSDFAERAINFYAGLLSAQNHTDFFAEAIGSTVGAVVASSETRLARLHFKTAVELAKLTHLLASLSDVDAEALRRLHIDCVDEVKRINGVLRLEDAVGR